jgi:hypothetical protein
METVTITTASGTTTAEGYIDSCGLAVTRATNPMTGADAWNITHLDSGKSVIAYIRTLAAAQSALRELAPLIDWHQCDHNVIMSLRHHQDALRTITVKTWDALPAHC